MVTSVETQTGPFAPLFLGVSKPSGTGVPEISACRLNNTSAKRPAPWCRDRHSSCGIRNRVLCIPALENEGVSHGCRGGLSRPAAAI